MSDAPEGARPTSTATSGLRGVLLTVAYDGRGFAGWAPQPSQRTIAGELLGALRAIDPTIAEVRGASRTDAGVHARGQRAAFDTQADVPMKGWVLGVTRHLPAEIAVRRAASVRVGLVPRFENAGKRYRYTLLADPVRDPMLDGRVWRLPELCPASAVARAAAEAPLAEGKHDFAAFRSAADERTSTERTLRRVRLVTDPADARLLHVEVEGDAFLHNMVRILVGTIVDVARGRIAPGAIERALRSGDRRDAGITAPPDGLCLERVELRDEGDGAWP